jgi:protein phosphatase 1 regulatory subunit 7
MTQENRSSPTNSQGWDGKLRLDRGAVVMAPGALSEPEGSDEDVPAVEQVAADEGKDFFQA